MPPSMVRPGPRGPGPGLLAGGGEGLGTRAGAVDDPLGRGRGSRGIPWPEYPRPQMVRDRWLSLNGLWEFAFADGRRGGAFRPQSGP